MQTARTSDEKRPPPDAKKIAQIPLQHADAVREVVTHRRLQAAFSRFCCLACREMNDDPEGHSGIDLTGPADDIGLGIIVEIAFREGRRIEH